MRGGGEISGRAAGRMVAPRGLEEEQFAKRGQQGHVPFEAPVGPAHRETQEAAHRRAWGSGGESGCTQILDLPLG